MRGFPKRWVVVDTEARNERDPSDPGRRALVFRLGCAWRWDSCEEGERREEWLDFADPERFHRWLCAAKLDPEPIYVFAHNMGFDARMLDLFRFLGTGTYRIDPTDATPNAGKFHKPLFIADSRNFIVRTFAGSGQRIIWCDTYQWLRRSLADIGAMTRVGKLPMPPDDALDADWAEYCRGDVVCLRNAIHHLWTVLGASGTRDWELSVGAQAMREFRRTNKGHCTLGELPGPLVDLEREGYHGGRVECYRLGPQEGTTFGLDVTSMYPYVMKCWDYPYEVEHFCGDGRKKKPWDDRDWGKRIAEVWLETGEADYQIPCEGGNLSGRGRVKTVLPGPELRVAYERGEIRHVGRWAQYTMGDVYARYVDKYYKLREGAKRNGDRFADHIWKLMLNTLHGKFGQRSGEWQYGGFEGPKGRYGSGHVVGLVPGVDSSYRIVDGHLWLCPRDGLADSAFVPLASWVASGARVIADQYAAVAGHENLIYHCVDGWIARRPALDGLRHAGLMGQEGMGFVREDSVNQRLHIYGDNAYETDNRLVLAGIGSGGHIRIGDYVEHDQWSTVETAVASGKVSEVVISRALKRLSRNYWKRRVLSSGETVPWLVASWDVPAGVKPKREDIIVK